MNPRQLPAVALASALLVSGCGGYARSGGGAEAEEAQVGGEVAVPTTTAGAGTPGGAPEPRPGDTVPAATTPQGAATEGTNFRTRTDRGFELTVIADPEDGGDGLLLQLNFKNVSRSTLYHDSNQEVLFEIVRPDGSGFRWTDLECRAFGPRERTTGGPIAVEPGDEGSFIARYPTARKTSASSAPAECYLPAGEYVLRGFLDSCPESAWVSEDGAQPYCDPAKIQRLSVEMPLRFS